MNGAPYYSAPHRHQKSYMSRLGTLAGHVLKPELAEFPALVAAAIRRGIIQRPDSSQTIPPPVAKISPQAAWQTIACMDCGETFNRWQRKTVKCQLCRSSLQTCQSCGVEFRSTVFKKVGCSPECSRAMGILRLKQSAIAKGPPKVAECIICHEIRPVRRSGNGVAKTCSPECSKIFRAECRKIFRAARNQKRTK